MSAAVTPKANPAKPGFPITLDKPRRLLFDLNALAALEEQTGRNMLSEEGWAPLQQLSAKTARLLLWAGFLHEDPELTLEAAGALITPERMADIAAAIEGATAASLPEAEPERPLAGKARRRSRRAGSNSGASRAATSALASPHSGP